jgi:hypothetical protein
MVCVELPVLGGNLREIEEPPCAKSFLSDHQAKLPVRFLW